MPPQKTRPALNTDPGTLLAPFVSDLSICLSSGSSPCGERAHTSSETDLSIRPLRMCTGPSLETGNNPRVTAYPNSLKIVVCIQFSSNGSTMIHSSLRQPYTCKHFCPQDPAKTPLHLPRPMWSVSSQETRPALSADPGTLIPFQSDLTIRLFRVCSSPCGDVHKRPQKQTFRSAPP